MRLVRTIAALALSALAACSAGDSPAGSAFGTWTLLSSLHETGAKPASGDDAHRRAQIEGWLRGNSLPHLGAATPTRGLTLTISRDGRFTETKSGVAKTVWYDADGVEHLDDAVPFDGRLAVRDGALFLRPDLPAAAMAVRLKHEQRFPGLALRIDDGDTLIVDRVDVAGDALVRTMSVVTDGAYLSRVTLGYGRVSP